MSIFRIFFPQPTKQTVLEKIAYHEAKLQKMVEHERLSKYINHSLNRSIEETSGKIAELKVMLGRFKE